VDEGGALPVDGVDGSKGQEERILSLLERREYRSGVANSGVRQARQSTERQVLLSSRVNFPQASHLNHRPVIQVCDEGA